ncbi:signal peptidase I [Hippea maritima]|uniref:Signal peptidase I n=1 Tax=Hippea maritima (strain ATCC 700847 / DSM 10411 / MH2) TaxID=760142 RepID=F2LVW5_HIPMA|nr:signal peptidase I [Hippea maritima]AEA33899.1 signal peptidase I [Hippea maritima DSM 10411]
MSQDKKQSKLGEWIKSIIIALIIALFIRAFFVEAFKIPSSSMEPTLLVGDHVLANRFIYGIKVPITGKMLIPIKHPQRGDVVIFRWPKDRSIYFIKRCIGIPGDTLEMKDKVLYRNNKMVKEPYVVHRDPNIYSKNTDISTFKTIWGSRDNWGPIKVPKGKYFMMGDNRDNSYDSRYWGFVPEKNIVGKAFIIYGSWTFSPFEIRFNRFFKLIH